MIDSHLHLDLVATIPPRAIIERYVAGFARDSTLEISGRNLNE
jgi:hypothetical protein